MPMTQYSYCDIASIPLLCPCSLFSSFTLDFPLTRADEWMQLCTLTHQDTIIQKQTSQSRAFSLLQTFAKNKISIYACFHPLLSYLLQDFIHLCFPVSTLPLIGAGWRREEGLQVCWLTGGTGRLIQVRLHLRNLQYLTQLSVVHDLVKEIIHDQTCGTLSIIHAVCDAVILYCNML